MQTNSQRHHSENCASTACGIKIKTMEAQTEKKPETMDPAEKVRRFAEVARLLRESHGRISPPQYENAMQVLFEEVEGLDSIQKNARLRVRNLCRAT